MSDPLVTEKEQFIVVLDSRNATEYLNNTFNSSVLFQFEEPIRPSKHSLNMSCTVYTFTSPNSIYNINEYNNFLSITLHSIPSDILYNINIPYGNYNASTFITQLISQLTTDFSLTLNKINNKFTLSHAYYNFTINSTTTIYSVIGFEKSKIYDSSALSLIMPFTCNFNGIQNINIHFENLNIRNIDSYNKTKSSVIQSIPVDFTLQQIQYNKSESYYFKIYQDQLDYIRLDIKDDLENFINFNNQHWNLTLIFSELKDIDRFNYDNTFHSIIYNQGLQ